MGGATLPPTDPRLQELTDEQIELDMLLFLEDHPELKKRAESFKDESYEKDMEQDLQEESPPILPQAALPEPVMDMEPVPFDEDD